MNLSASGSVTLNLRALQCALADWSAQARGCAVVIDAHGRSTTVRDDTLTAEDREFAKTRVDRIRAQIKRIASHA